PDALHPVKIGEIGRGKGRILLLAGLQAAKSCLEEITFGEGGFSPSQLRLFSLCPKACYISFPSAARGTCLTVIFK
ncbi:MAG: hypothetical protein Q4G00_16900, partial [Clostridia bacterium]|nr:hypothetical protein [Clostridia bacterium]